MLRESRNRLTAGMLMGACLLVFGHCGPGDSGNSNSNDNGHGNDNANDNGGTGNTVDDLPDLSSDDFLGTGVFDPQGHLDLRQEGQRVFAIAVLIEIALLPAVTLHLPHAARLERSAAQTLQQLFHQKRFDDGDDLFHFSTPFRGIEATAVSTPSGAHNGPKWPRRS